MVIKVILVLALSFLSSAKKISFEDCGSNEIKSISVEPCLEEPCDFVAGNSYLVEGSFVPGLDAEKPAFDVEVMALGYWIPYPGLDPEPCQNYLECPLKKGEESAFQVKATAVGILHNVNSEVRVKIYQDSSKETMIACAVAEVHAV